MTTKTARIDDLIWQVGLEPWETLFQLPIAASVATVLDLPWMRTMTEDGLAAAAEAQERLAVAQEHIEDRWAEMEQAVAEKVAEHNSKARNGLINGGERSLISLSLIGAAEELNGWARDLTGNEVDLGLIIPVAFGAIAIRQFMVQGIRLKDIPWYVPAWYAFDTFLKLNFPEHEMPHPDIGSPPQTPPAPPANDLEEP
ncbi:MAG: hypothetical protein VKL20_05920 [Synechocystis sp.]|nr:hypothetical protein [Synechocystis sp.]